MYWSILSGAVAGKRKPGEDRQSRHRDAVNAPLKRRQSPTPPESPDSKRGIDLADAEEWARSASES